MRIVLDAQSGQREDPWVKDTGIHETGGKAADKNDCHKNR